MKLTIEELADEFNKLISKVEYEYKNTDKRVKNEISVRRIQTYITQGLLDKPIKEGNRAYFNEQHLNKLVLLRQYTMSGLSDSSLKNIENLSSQYSKDEETERVSSKGVRSDALNAILDIKRNSLPKNEAQRAIYNMPLVSNIGSTLSKTTRNWQEIQLDKEGTVFLRVEYGKVLDKEEILNNIKQFLNIV